jgi:YD repeat-containing protein
VGGVPHKLLRMGTGYLFVDSNTGVLETYDLSGRLTLLTQPDGTTVAFSYSGENLMQALAQDGRAIQFAYDGNGYITSITATGQQPITAGYDSNYNLTGLTWQDGKTLGLPYENAELPWALTGQVDESGVRVGTYTYSADGVATGTERAGGVDSYSVSYSSVPQRILSSVYDATAQVWRDSIVDPQGH